MTHKWVPLKITHISLLFKERHETWTCVSLLKKDTEEHEETNVWTIVFASTSARLFQQHTCACSTLQHTAIPVSSSKTDRTEIVFAGTIVFVSNAIVHTWVSFLKKVTHMSLPLKERHSPFYRKTRARVFLLKKNTHMSLPLKRKHARESCF